MQLLGKQVVSRFFYIYILHYDTEKKLVNFNKYLVEYCQ